MRIETYFYAIQSVIDAFPLTLSMDISFSKRGATLGFLRGDLILIDASTLHIREFVDAQNAETEDNTDRIIYAYHFMDAQNRLLFRYDNADHHRDLNLPTHPHHKHIGEDNQIVASSAPRLKEVLDEIKLMIELL